MSAQTDDDAFSADAEGWQNISMTFNSRLLELLIGKHICVCVLLVIMSPHADLDWITTHTN